MKRLGVSRALSKGGISEDGLYSFAEIAFNMIRGIDWAHTMRVLSDARSSKSDAVWRSVAVGFFTELARRRGELELAWNEIRSALPSEALRQLREKCRFGPRSM